MKKSIISVISIMLTISAMLMTFDAICYFGSLRTIPINLGNGASEMSYDIAEKVSNSEVHASPGSKYTLRTEDGKNVLTFVGWTKKYGRNSYVSGYINEDGTFEPKVFVPATKVNLFSTKNWKLKKFIHENYSETKRFYVVDRWKEYPIGNSPIEIYVLRSREWGSTSVQVAVSGNTVNEV